MSDMNLVVLSGTIDTPLTYREGTDGKKSFAKFALTARHSMRDKVEDAVVNCVAFGPLADRVNAQQRSAISVAGRLVTERFEWQGKPCTKLILRCDSVLALVSAPVSDPKSTAPTAAPAGIDEAPF